MADENKTKEVVEEISPAEYFEMVKSRMQEETEENIRLLYNTTITKLKKYMVTGQVKAAKELYSRCVYLEKEIQLVRKGITQYVLRTDIDNYIEKIAGKCVCIIELKNFDRDIPDDIIDRVAETKEIFDEYFVVFTDYTGEKRSKVEKERREKDPILFGNIFVDGIGDWIDDYCELTLDKMIEEIAKKDKSTTAEILHNIDDYSLLDNIERELFDTSSRIDKRAKSNKEKDSKEVAVVPPAKKRGRPRKNKTDGK